jgi:hypothetical protein
MLGSRSSANEFFQTTSREALLLLVVFWGFLWATQLGTALHFYVENMNQKPRYVPTSANDLRWGMFGRVPTFAPSGLKP